MCDTPGTARSVCLRKRSAVHDATSQEFVDCRKFRFACLPICVAFCNLDTLAARFVFVEPRPHPSTVGTGVEAEFAVARPSAQEIQHCFWIGTFQPFLLCHGGDSSIRVSSILE